MIADMRHSIATAGVVLLLACSAPAQQTPPPGPDDVAARVGDRTITMRELEEWWRQDDPGQHARLTQMIYEGRRTALDAMIAALLIERAANEAGVSAEDYEQAEIAERTVPVTDDDVAAFFQSNQSQMQGQTLEAMAPLIRDYLGRQRQGAAREALVADLREAGPAVTMVLDAPRYAVPVAADDAASGRDDALVTIVEFSDFQCPFCAQAMPTLRRLRETYGDQVRLVWKDFPLTTTHPQAFRAAEAGNCAREQGKFWEYHDRLFAQQHALLPDQLKAHAVAAGLDANRFDACLDSGKYRQRVQDHLDLGAELGVASTPSVFINGRPVIGAQPYEAFAAVVDEELERASR
jgi:protein-disulfide isomerase